MSLRTSIMTPRMVLALSLLAASCAQHATVPAPSPSAAPLPIATIAPAPVEPSAVPRVVVEPTSRPAPPAALATVVIGQGGVVLRGVISREETEHTANEAFVAHPGASLSIEIRRYQGEDADAPLVLAATMKLPAGRFSLPVRYELRGDPRKLDAHTTYFVSGELEDGTGFKLMSEYRNEIAGAEHVKDFVVSGLEPCNSPRAGGFCQ